MLLWKKNNLDHQDVTKYTGMDSYFKIIPDRSFYSSSFL